MDRRATVRGEQPDASLLVQAAHQDASSVLAQLGTRPEGLTSAEAAARLATTGPNALRQHKAQPWPILMRQVKSPILVLLFVTAAVSLFLGEATNALIIGVILAASIGLGFANEFRAERSAQALHEQSQRTVTVVRDGSTTTINVADLVPGDITHIAIGSIVPADMRLLASHDLSCDEGILTGESLPSHKDPLPAGTNPAITDLTSCVLMGTVVQSGSATAVVAATGRNTEFGRISVGLGTQQPQTEFQRGLGRFSLLLLEVAVTLTSVIFVANVLLHRPILDALLFSLAIAVGITPQLLPAVVSASLASGSRALAKRKVLVKRLVCIEDLGDMDMLATDKTGTLTEGKISFVGGRTVPTDLAEPELLRLGLLATEADYGSGPVVTEGLNSLDTALWVSPQADACHLGSERPLDVIPFDYTRRRTTVLVATATDSELSPTCLLVTKGAPEDVLPLCVDVPSVAQERLASEYASGHRVVAVAHRNADTLTHVTEADEVGFSLDGFLIFLDRPKSDAKDSLAMLTKLGISLKVLTGDGALVTETLLADLGLTSGGTLSGTEIAAMTDDVLREAAVKTTVFARVSPEQKARVVRLL